MHKLKRLAKCMISAAAALALVLPQVSFSEDTAADGVEAVITLTKPVVGRHISFVDGMERGITDEKDPLYSEYFIMEGVEARKVYKENYVYFKLDKDFYRPGDHTFLISVTYWDFGPDIGYFHVEYNSDQSPNQRISLQKTGKVQKWITKQIYIENADFGGKMNEDADIRLVSNAYNAFAKLKVVNIDAAKRNNIKVDIDPVAEESASVLHNIGLYDGVSQDTFDPGLQLRLTRYDMLKLFLQGTRQYDDAAVFDGECGFSDVDGERAPVVGYARAAGLVAGDGAAAFRPDDIATVREFLTVVFRYMGYGGDDIYTDALNAAERERLVLKENLIIDADGQLKRDNLAAVLRNMLGLRNFKNGENIMKLMVEAGRIKTDALIGSDYESYCYIDPQKVEKRRFYDAGINREWFYMNINGKRAIRPYVTEQHWSSDGTKFIIHNDQQLSLYEYNVETQMLKRLDDTTASASATGAVVSPHDKILYQKKTDELWLMDWKTGETKRVARIPEGVQTSVYQITHDERYATCYWFQTKEPDDYMGATGVYHIVPRLDLETGEWDTSLRHRFTDTPDYPHLGHAQINPTDPDLMMFCHEGTTLYVPDRIWTGRVSTGESSVLFRQATRDDNMTGETTGHEVWAIDGKSVFFVKYYFPNTNIGQQGVVRVNLDGSREYINGDYRYWHCYPSADGNWVAADTQLGDRSEIVLMNTNTYESHVIARFSTRRNPQHPYQPHPIISYDGRYVSWQMVDENDMLGVGWADISEFTKDTKQQTVKKFPSGIEFVTHPDAASAVREAHDGEGEYYIADPDKGIYCRIDDKYDGSESKDVTLRITYKDNGRQNFTVRYTGFYKTSADFADREDESVTVKRTNTGKWLSTDITLKGVNLNDACKYRTDLCITGSTYSNVQIRNVELLGIE